ncbi:MAG: porin, partial [Hydrogenophilaceae bacterium]
MKKSLIALAVAGVFAAPAAFAASANVDVYGIMSFAIEDTDADGVDVAVVDRVSRLGFKGSEDLGGGLKAIWQIESQLNATTNENLGNIYYSGGPVGRTALRNTFVGLAGDFGVFVLGRHDTPYKLGTGSLDV